MALRTKAAQNPIDPMRCNSPLIGSLPLFVFATLGQLEQVSEGQIGAVSAGS